MTKLIMRDTTTQGMQGVGYLLPANANIFYLDALTAQGSSVKSTAISTQAGPTNPIGFYAGQGGEWITPPLHADVTLTGNAVCNVRINESSMSANLTAYIQILWYDSMGVFKGSIAGGGGASEAGTSEGAMNFTIALGSTNLKKGDRLVIAIGIDDAPSTNMASGYTGGLWYNGSAGASGDTYVDFTSTTLDFTAIDAPVTKLYPTDVASDISTGTPSLLSAFTGSDENPLSEGGNWASVTGTNQLKRLSNQAAPAASSTPCRSYWTPDVGSGTDVEAYVTYAATSTNCRVILGVRGGSLGGTSFTGYSIEFLNNGTLYLYRVDAGVNQNLASLPSGTITFAAGDKIGISAHGDVISAYYQPSGTSTWRKMLFATDSTYASGKVWLGIYDASTTARVDDIYAGATIGYFEDAQEASIGASGGSNVNVATSTVSGQTYGLPIAQATTLREVSWLTPPLEAVDITAGSILTVKVGVVESDVPANVVPKFTLTKTASNGGDETHIVTGIARQEMPVGSTAYNTYYLQIPSTVSVATGERLRLRYFGDDLANPGAMLTGYTFTFAYGGSNDSWWGFEQTLTEYVPATARVPRREQQYAQLIAG